MNNILLVFFLRSDSAHDKYCPLFNPRIVIATVSFAVYCLLLLSFLRGNNFSSPSEQSKHAELLGIPKSCSRSWPSSPLLFVLGHLNFFPWTDWNLYFTWATVGRCDLEIGKVIFFGSLMLNCCLKACLLDASIIFWFILFYIAKLL